MQTKRRRAQVCGAKRSPGIRRSAAAAPAPAEAADGKPAAMQRAACARAAPSRRPTSHHNLHAQSGSGAGNSSGCGLLIVQAGSGAAWALVVA